MTTYELMRQQAHTERQLHGAWTAYNASVDIAVRTAEELGQARATLNDIAAIASAVVTCPPGACGKCDTLRTIGDRVDAALEADDE